MTTPNTTTEEVVAAEIVGANGEKLPTSAELAMTRHREDAPVSLTLAKKSPMELIETALRLGASIEQTQQLINLQRDVEQYEARKLFFAAIAAFKSEVGPIFKNRASKEIGRETAAKFSYTWASLDSIESAIAAPLAKNGLSYTWDHDQEGTSVTTICVVRHEAGHEHRTSVKLAVAGSPGMSDHQKVQSTMQYGRRASLTSALGLSTTEEDPNASDASVDKVTDEQVATVNDSLQDTGVNVARFLKYMGVESVVDIRAADMPKALSAIQAFHRQGQKDGGAGV